MADLPIWRRIPRSYLVVSLAALFLTYAAFDDITTDKTATTFWPEWFWIGASLAWLLFVAWRLRTTVSPDPHRRQERGRGPSSTLPPS